MTPGLYHYYSTELAFYWSLLFSQFSDIKRKVRGSSSCRSPPPTTGSGRSHGRASAGRGGGGGSSSPPGLWKLCTRVPLSCDPTGLMPLEFHRVHRIEAWLCLTATRGAGQSQQRVLAAAGTVLGVCPPWACRGRPSWLACHTHMPPSAAVWRCLRSLC